MAIRCFCNLAVKYTNDTDIGDLVAKFCKVDLSSLEDGINILLEVDLHTATDGLKKLLSIIPKLLEMKSNKYRELELFFNSADNCVHDANKAFHSVRHYTEKIRCVQIECCATIATAATGEREPSIIRTLLGEAIRRLFDMQKIQDDLKNFFSDSYLNLDFKSKRNARIRAVFKCLLQCEVYVAANQLSSIYTEYINPSFSMNKIFEKDGIFKETEFSPQEQCVISSYIGEAFSSSVLNNVLEFIKKCFF
jgi:hypothetical protein